MLDKLRSLFIDLDEINTSNYEGFMEFYTSFVKDFPGFLRKNLKERGINPIMDSGANPKDKYKTWYLCFTPRDLLWWRSMWELHKPVFKPLSQIKQEVYDAALDVIDGFPETPETDKIYKELLKEFQNPSNS